MHSMLSCATREVHGLSCCRLLRWINKSHIFCAVGHIHFAVLRSIKVPFTAMCDRKASVAGTFKADAAC